MVGLIVGSVASRQDKSWRRPGEYCAGRGDVTPEEHLYLLQMTNVCVNKKRAPLIIFIIRAGRVEASKALLQAQSS